MSKKAKPSRSSKPAAVTAGFNIRWKSKQASTMRGHKHVTAASEKEARRDFEMKYPDAQIVEVTT